MIRLIRFTRASRYFLVALIFLVPWGIAIWQLVRPTSHANNAPESEQPVSAFDTVIAADTSALSGRLIFVEQRAQYRIAQVDFVTRTISTIIDVPAGALVYQMAKTPDPQHLVMTYSAPASAGQNSFDRNGVYDLNLNDGILTRLFGEDKAGVYYSYPQQAGNSITYVIYDQNAQTRRIEAYDLTSHAITLVANSATLPTVYGTTVAYFSINHDTQARSLWIKATSGSQPVQLVDEHTFTDIDVPMFSPDGAWIYFAVLENQPTPISPTAFDRWLGIMPVYAHGNHNLPARWYRVAATGATGVTGGSAEPVSETPLITIAGDFNNEMLGFISDTGFYIVRNRTAEQIVRSRVMSSFVWLP